MEDADRILVATDVTADAEFVQRLLADEFDDVSVSTDPEQGAQDFERTRPNLLVLAFNTLEKAERHYLGLYRHSQVIHALPHRTVILCNKDDLRRVYQLCKKEYFDDYVLFWPMTNDAARLLMSAHHALRQLATDKVPQTARDEVIRQARRIAELEAQMAKLAERGMQQVEIAGRSLRQAGQDIGAALDGFSRNLADDDSRDVVRARDRAGFANEFDRLKKERIEPHLETAWQAVQPVGQWAGALQGDLARLDSARVLRALTESTRPLLLIVDDDEFQRQRLASVLGEVEAELFFAASGAEAFSALRRRRPDVILMDVGLPDISGVEVVRRIKSVEQFARIPVVMVTGHSDRELVVESLNAGATDFVVKPVEHGIMLAKLRKCLGNGSSP